MWLLNEPPLTIEETAAGTSLTSVTESEVVSGATGGACTLVRGWPSLQGTSTEVERTGSMVIG